MLNVFGSCAKYFSSIASAFDLMSFMFALQIISIGSNLNRNLVRCCFVLFNSVIILVTNSNGFVKVLLIKITFFTPVSTT